MTRVGSLVRTAWTVVMDILSLDWFWSVWLAAVVGVELGVAWFVGPSVAVRTYAIPLYMGVAGGVSVLYAFLFENGPRWTSRAGDETGEARQSPMPGRAPSRSSGESMIPGVSGMVLVSAAIFLAVAIARDDVAVLVVGLPIVFGVAPLFVLFAYGYTRGAPAIGAFAYRWMPWGLGLFIGGAVVIRLAREYHVLGGAGRVLVPALLIGIALVFLVVNFIRNSEARRPVSPAPSPASADPGQD